MAKTRSDIANTAVRIFLQEMGKEYDRERDLEPFAKKHLKGEVLEFFEGRCCFCGVELTASRVYGDHLIPTNKKDLGLDAWGNIVPACNPCNSEKHGSDWRDFIIQRAGPDAAERHQRMQEFLNAYPYTPTYELGSIVADLYDEAGAVAMALIHEKVVRTKETLQPTT
ncbi:MAG TPA: HNH endonuclease signature motif containing protein [Solirubrobacterales bacterium]|nr:HNH endonuclease signature motif containing protein [Solirubrobacterales bacterium]